MENAGNVSDKPSYTFWLDMLGQQVKIITHVFGAKVRQNFKESLSSSSSSCQPIHQTCGNLNQV
jgi:hypothetical protein